MIKIIIAMLLSFSAIATTYIPISAIKDKNAFTFSATTAQDSALILDMRDAEKYIMQIKTAEATPAAFTITSTANHIDTFNNRFYKAAHGLVTGSSVAITTSSSLPIGLTGAGFFASKIDDDFFYIMDTRAKAITGTPAIVITSQGSGVQTFTPSGSYRGNVGIQYSLDGSTWTTIQNYSDNLGTSTLEDDNFNANWLRMTVEATQGQLYIKTDVNVK